jgi:hypothetical protein
LYESGFFDLHVGMFYQLEWEFASFSFEPGIQSRKNRCHWLASAFFAIGLLVPVQTNSFITLWFVTPRASGFEGRALASQWHAERPNYVGGSLLPISMPGDGSSSRFINVLVVGSAKRMPAASKSRMICMLTCSPKARASQ